MYILCQVFAVNAIKNIVAVRAGSAGKRRAATEPCFYLPFVAFIFLFPIFPFSPFPLGPFSVPEVPSLGKVKVKVNAYLYSASS